MKSVWILNINKEQKTVVPPLFVWVCKHVLPGKTKAFYCGMLESCHPFGNSFLTSLSNGWPLERLKSSKTVSFNSFSVSLSWGFTNRICGCVGIVWIIDGRTCRGWQWSWSRNRRADWRRINYMGWIIGIVVLLPRLTRTGRITGAWAPKISISVSEMPTNSCVCEWWTDRGRVRSRWCVTLSFCAVQIVVFHISVVKIFLSSWMKIVWGDLNRYQSVYRRFCHFNTRNYCRSSCESWSGLIL